jgi:hypothetical protein
LFTFFVNNFLYAKWPQSGEVRIIFGCPTGCIKPGHVLPPFSCRRSMRRLLLLLLTFLLPLQLLAATVGDVSTQRVVQETSPACLTASPRGEPAQHEVAPQAKTWLQGLATDAPASPQPGDDDEPDAPALQADCEDHTLPAGLATPNVSWHPFPHAFAAPLNWPSFDRDQLRPPPLA